MIEVTRLNFDRCTAAEKAAYSAATAPALGRHPFDAAVEKAANALLARCSELHSAGKTGAEIHEFLKAAVSQQLKM